MSEAEVKDRKGYTVAPIRAQAPPPRLHSTYTYVELEVSKGTYDEVKYLLTQAGYDHCFSEVGSIDLSGIALTRGDR